ncbi:MAG: tRNA (adenosine(37)-N6)-threonylcarbamoyltransferase complex dimerization subunit type 1 TsaB [Verrucomicrobia bacterium]|nr:tRNA (adenosine(37)-N6)-threonylcarbamoyltransferase complex dimerization subunit type 1 TsaB [Verrucomicrobiota bacterium]
MTALLIDTATERGVIALFSEGKLCTAQELAVGLTNSQNLLPSINALFSQVGMEPSHLSYVGVSHGPGSYTGIRVGVATAKALSLALAIPLVGFGSLRGYVPPKECSGPFFAAIDAKIGGVYLLKGRWKEESVEFVDEEELVPFESFIDRIHEVECIVTPNRLPLATRLEAKGVNNYPEIIEKAPSATALMHEADKRFKNNFYSFDGSLPLLYLRKTQAELNE